MTAETPSREPWPGYRAFPDRLNLAEEVLHSAFKRGARSRAALVSDSGATSYETLERRVNALAAGLIELGLKKGDLALIKMSNSAEFAIAFLATVKLGVIPVLVNSLLSGGELRTVVEQARPRLAFTEPARAEAVRELRDAGLLEKVVCAGDAASGEIPFASLEQRVDRLSSADTAANEPAFIVYTSGTTGTPKGIVHAHRWIVALGDLNRYRLPPRENDVIMATAEWSFISALGHNLLFPLRNGVTGAILSGRATPENVVQCVRKFNVTVLYSVATVYRRLLAMPHSEGGRDLRNLRCAHSTGEALREATYKEWRERFGSELYEHYGVSEYQLVIGHGGRHPVRAGSVGKLLPGVGAAILDDDLRPVAGGDLGQFAISTRDPGLFLGYYKDLERTEAVIRNGWYLTGDLAYQDAAGYFYIAGRRDDCFKSRGIFIAPAEIENALQEDPAVIETAVIPEPDGDIGNRIRAVVVLADGHAPSDDLAQTLRESLRGRLAPFKIPHKIEFAPSLPKSAVGKILRGALTAQSKD